MVDHKQQLSKIYRLLLNHFNHRNWWPGDSPFEVMVGAILTQNTSWKNVEKAMANLKEAGVLSPEKILELSPSLESKINLPSLIRSSGYFNQKAKKLQTLSRWFLDRADGKVGKLIDTETHILREELLNLNGVGPETADSILLYAFERPVFVIDAYTKRIMFRIGITEEKSSYHDLQLLFESNLPRDIQLYNDFHAQFVALGHNYCRPKPICQNCPIQLHCNQTRVDASESV